MTNLPFEESEVVRQPGLYRAWELCRFANIGSRLLIEETSETADGEPLFAVYTAVVEPETTEVDHGV